MDWLVLGGGGASWLTHESRVCRWLTQDVNDYKCINNPPNVQFPETPHQFVQTTSKTLNSGRFG